MTPPTLREILITTFHGVNRISSSQYPILRFLWIGLSFATVISFSWHLSQLVRTYVSVPTSITTWTDTSQLPFKYPTITICNGKVLTGSVLFNYNFSSNLSAEDRFVRQQYSENQDFVSNFFKTYKLHVKQRSELFTKTFRDTFTNYYSNFTDFSKHQMDIKHMIIDYLIGMEHKACSHTGFYEIRHPKYLQCYTFNHSLFESAARYSGMTPEDIKNGLALHLSWHSSRMVIRALRT